MQEFHHTLPLATGYFGLSSALYPFGGLIVIYGPAGGAWHINIEDEPRWYRGPATVVGAGLLEMDVILGNEDKFLDNIAKVATDLDRRFVVLAGTPISEIIGADLQGFARTLERRTSVPVFMVPTAGSEPYPEGASKALLALADVFMDPDAPKRPRGVNVLGAIHLATGKPERLEPLFKAIEDGGFELVGALSEPRDPDDPLAGVRDAPGAAVNAVVSAGGLPLAERMYADHGIPYVLGMPVGRSGREDFLALLRGERPAEPRAPARPAPCNHALVVGEPVLSHGLRRCLVREFGVPRADVVNSAPSGGLFAPSEGRRGSLAEPGPHDVDTDSEQAIAELMNAPGVDCVLADPCYRPLLRNGARFIDLPHTAMSARIHWDMPYEYAVEAGGAYLEAKLFGKD